MNALNFWRLELDLILSPFDSKCEVIVPLTDVSELLIYPAKKIYEIGFCSFASGIWWFRRVRFISLKAHQYFGIIRHLCNMLNNPPAM